MSIEDLLIDFCLKRGADITLHLDEQSGDFVIRAEKLGVGRQRWGKFRADVTIRRTDVSQDRHGPAKRFLAWFVRKFLGERNLPLQYALQELAAILDREVQR